MKAVTMFLAGGAAIAALAGAAPASAQIFPGMGFPGYGVPPGPGYGGYGYGVPGGGRVAASQCTAAVQQRLGGYGGYGYGYGVPAGRVVGINSVEIRQDGGYRVRGTAIQGGYSYGGGTIGFTCRTDPRGLVTGVAFNNRYYGNRYPGYPGYPGNGYYGNGYYGPNTGDPNNPYAVYGYSRY